jgi:hypothetical protein
VKHLLLALLLLTACAPTVELFVAEGPFYFELEFTSVPQGLDPASPVPFSTDARAYDLRVSARGYDRQPMDWSGTLAVHASPGVLEGGRTVTVTGGVAQFTARLALGFGELNIWVSDEEGGSYAVGAAPPVYIEYPTVAQLQRPLGSDDESPLTHQYVTLRGFSGDDPRELVVTTVTNDGFYVTDRSDPPGSFNSLFVFTFSRPDGGIQVGSRLADLSGIVSEFIGFTELQFPTFNLESQGHDVGPAVLLDPSIVCDDDVMEGYEASVVRVEDVTSDFQRASDCNNYEDFAQWPAALPGECGGNPSRITVVNANTVPSFNFPECEQGVPPAERYLEYLIGVLRHTAPADPPWIVEARSCLDFPEEHRPDDCAQLLARPMSGPRIAPTRYYRDIQTCEGVPYGYGQ